MNNKSLFLGAAALALLMLFTLVGCSNPASSEHTVSYDYEGLLVTADELAAVLADPENNPGTYAYLSDENTTDTLGDTGYTAIPAGITLNLYGGFTTAGNLSVGGALNIVKGSTLTAANAGTKKLIIGIAGVDGKPKGVVTVRAGGALAVDAANALELAQDEASSGGSGATPVAVIDDQIIDALNTGVVQGHTAHGEAIAARLIFERDSSYLPATELAIPLSVGEEKLKKAAADGIFATNLSTEATSVTDLTIRRGTSLTNANSAAFAPLGTLTVNGTLTTTTGSVIVGVARVIVGPAGKIEAKETGDTFQMAVDLQIAGELEVGDDATFASVETAGGPGTLILGNQNFGSVAGVLFGIKNVTSAATAITAATLTVPEGTALTLSAAAVPSGNLVVNGVLNSSAALTPAGNVTVAGTLNKSGSTALTIAADKILDISGVVALSGTANVTLTGGPATGAGTAGAKLTGTGKLTAGNTEISGGGAEGWQALNATNAEPVIIASVTTTASITGTANAKLVAGVGATIIQNAGAGNNLSIPANTTIELGGTTTEAGAIILKNSPEVGYTNAGKLTLAATTSVIKTGQPVGYATGKPVLAAGAYSTASGSDFVGLAIPFLHGDANTLAKTSAAAPALGVGLEGKLVELAGGTAGVLTGGDATPTVDGTKDGRISSLTITQPTEPAP
jgi:hypothetical protein